MSTSSNTSLSEEQPSASSEIKIDANEIDENCEKDCTCHHFTEATIEQDEHIMSEVERRRRKRSRLCFHSRGCFVNAMLGALVNFGVGFGLKIIVHTLRSWLRGKSLTIPAPKSFGEFMNMDATRFGLFLGMFSGGYKSINCLLRNILEEDNKLNAFVAGSISGISILWLEKDDRAPIAVYLFIRAVKMAFDKAYTRDWFPKELVPVHSDSYMFILSACQILFAYILEQDSLPPSYMKFLFGAGKKDPRVIAGLKAVGRNQRFNWKELNAYCAEKNISLDKMPPTDGQSYPLCHIMHPNVGCVEHYGKFTLDHLRSYSLRFYIPLNIVSLIIFQRNRLLTSPVRTLWYVLKSCLYSATFLSFYCGNAWLAQCTMRKMGIYSGFASWLLGGIAAGACIFLEQKSRRVELAMYCMSPALQSFYRCIRSWGFLSSKPYLESAMFAIAMGIIMSAHQNERSRMSPTLQKIMKGLMGFD